MEQFNQLFKNILLEQDMDVFKVGIFPGAFKPPHIGHFTTAYNACKDNDMVYIFVSDKPRPLSTQNKGKAEIPDINRYSNIMNSDKYTSNLLGVQPAGVARMTSATAFRAAISLKDKNTIAKGPIMPIRFPLKKISSSTAITTKLKVNVRPMSA